MLTTNQPLIALGRVKLGESRHMKFLVRNESDQSTRIENISVGCGACTIASTEKSVLEPNGTTTINVIFTPNSTGQQVKSVTLHYPTGRKLVVKFTAEVHG